VGQQQGVVAAQQPVFDASPAGELIDDGEQLVEFLLVLAHFVDQPLADGLMAHGEPGAITAERIAAKFIIHSSVHSGRVSRHGQGKSCSMAGRI